MTILRNLALLAIAAVTVGGVAVFFKAPEYGRSIRLRFGAVSVDDLVSQDPNLVMNTLYHLEKRRDASGQERARVLLDSDDDYIWLNAATYLAALGDKLSVPFLIKSITHPASRSLNERVASLEELTGLQFGDDREAWIRWWKETHPESKFQFRYLNYEREAARLSSSTMLLINGVRDAITIRQSGVTIRLIGVRPKNGVRDPEAIRLLETLVVNQLVRLRFDGGDKLDSAGRRRALVYWCKDMGSEHVFLRSLRRGLPPVPFDSLPGRNPLLLPYEDKPLIQRHLIESGLYEPELEEIEDAELRALLEES